VVLSKTGGARFTYFSFFTITTLGYSDIISTINLASVASMLEAFVEQAYLVVLVARLVGTHIAHSLRKSNSN